MSENDLIPYKASHLPAGPWLVMAPHPDDETFGMGGTLALAAKEGIKVSLAIVTSGDRGGEVSVRRAEAEKAANILGITDLEFWGLKDREIPRQKDEFLKRLSDGLARLNPRTIFLPSPLEYHPDHRGVSLLTMDFLDTLFGQGASAHMARETGLALKTTLSGSRLWFYEVTRQCEANRLIRIDPVLGIKKAAIDIYKSQSSTADYHDTVLSINRARALTLDSNTKYAEAFFETAIKEPGLDIALRLNDYLAPGIGAVARFPLISVIIRTCNRPALLREALQSVALQTYPRIECLVINDGGQDVREIVKEFSGRMERLEYINLMPRRGRARAANEGIKRATGRYVSFLDDDDIFYPGHLLTLYQAIADKNTGVVYADSFKGIYEHLETKEKRILIKKLVYYSDDFSFAHLVFENYIPLPSLLIERGLVDEIGGFDQDFELYEDWDMLIRLAQKTPFLHIPKPTSEFRLGASGQITLKERGSDREFAAYARLAAKHKSLITDQHLYQFFKIAGYRRGEILRLRELLDAANDKIAGMPELLSAAERLRGLLDREKAKSAGLEEEKTAILARLNLVEQANKGLKDSVEALRKSNNELFLEKTALQSTLSEITNSAGWALLSSYRGMIDRLAPPHSRRGRWYFLARSALVVFKNEGMSGVKNRIAYRWRARLANRKPASPLDNISARGAGACTLFPPGERPVDIIIPVFNAMDDLKNCVESILRHTDLSLHRMVLIDDCSTDEEIRSYLKGLRASNHALDIKVVFNNQNLGFPATVNKGLRLSSTRDCLILNSDTIVTANWLNKLQRAAYARPLVATVTPFSNHAYICAFPKPLKYNFLPPGYSMDTLNRRLEELSLLYYPVIPFGSGFCLYIRRHALETIGLLDEKLFRKGYGEDADFCFRAARAGFLNILDDSTFIFHKGGASFESNKDPEALARKNAQIQENLQRLNARYPGYERLIKANVEELEFLRNYLASLI